MPKELSTQTKVSMILITIILFAVYFSTRHYPESPKVVTASSTALAQEEATPTPNYVTVVSNVIESVYDKTLPLSLSNGIFEATGAWVATNDDMVNKLNSVELLCEKTSQRCILAQADFMKWNETDSEINFRNNINFYKILSWDIDSGIIAKYEGDAATCQEDLIEINKSEVTFIESTKGDAGEWCPKDIPPQLMKLQYLNTKLKY